jgi:hypothetical protein
VDALRRSLDQPFMRRAKPSPPGLALGIATSPEAGLADLVRLNPFTTLWRQLGTYFPDPRLRQLFGRYATYVGASPFAAPGVLMLIAHVEQRGVWRSHARSKPWAGSVAQPIATTPRCAGSRSSAGLSQASSLRAVNSLQPLPWCSTAIRRHWQRGYLARTPAEPSHAWTRPAARCQP